MIKKIKAWLAGKSPDTAPPVRPAPPVQPESSSVGHLPFTTPTPPRTPRHLIREEPRPIPRRSVPPTTRSRYDNDGAFVDTGLSFDTVAPDRDCTPPTRDDSSSSSDPSPSSDCSSTD